MYFTSTSQKRSVFFCGAVRNSPLTFQNFHRRFQPSPFKVTSSEQGYTDNFSVEAHLIPEMPHRLLWAQVAHHKWYSSGGVNQLNLVLWLHVFPAGDSSP